MKYNENMICGKVPKRIRERTRENMEAHFMGLYDAFDEACRKYAKTAELRAAWYFSDYRKFIPTAYDPEFLDFSKYPTKA